MWHLLPKLIRASKHRLSTWRRLLKRESPRKSPPRSEGANQATLTAMALNARDGEEGCAAVRQIQLPFLLRRIATSARLDAVRMEAALRLDQADLMAQVVRDVADTPHQLVEETES